MAYVHTEVDMAVIDQRSLGVEVAFFMILGLKP